MGSALIGLIKRIAEDVYSIYKNRHNTSVNHLSISPIQQKTPKFGCFLIWLQSPRDGLLLRLTLSSAWKGLTTVFGMGTGVTLSLESRRHCIQIVKIFALRLLTPALNDLGAEVEGSPTAEVQLRTFAI